MSNVRVRVRRLDAKCGGGFRECVGWTWGTGRTDSGGGNNRKLKGLFELFHVVGNSITPRFSGFFWWDGTEHALFKLKTKTKAPAIKVKREKRKRNHSTAAEED